MARSTQSPHTSVALGWPSGRSGRQRLPELNGVALGVGQRGEASVRIDLRDHLDVYAGAPELGDHGVEVAYAEVDRPPLLGAPEELAALVERREDRGSRLLPPHRPFVGLGWRLDAQVLRVPALQRARVLGAKEHSSDTRHLFHVSPPPKRCCSKQSTPGTSGSQAPNFSASPSTTGRLER